MVSYKLGIVGVKEGRIIDLDSIVKIKNLEILDEFTSVFKDESELKIYLFEQNLIDSKESNKKLSVRYKYSGKVKKLPIVYSDSKKYFDVFYLRGKIQSLSNNIEFLEKLANHYSLGKSTFNRQSINVQDIRRYISDVRSNGGNLFESKSLEIAINDLLENAMFKSINRQTGEVKEDYRGLRDLALFVYNFEKTLENNKKLEETKQDEEWEQISIFDQKIEKTLDEEEIYSERELSPYPKNWNMGSDDEPLFPPNSEEEAMYKRYLDEINELVDDSMGPKKR